MATVLALVMPCGCVVDLVDGDVHPLASFDGADANCLELADHIRVAIVMLGSRSLGGSDRGERW